jgi:hypothetical protein
MWGFSSIWVSYEPNRSLPCCHLQTCFTVVPVLGLSRADRRTDNLEMLPVNFSSLHNAVKLCIVTLLSLLHCVTCILTALCHFYPHCTLSLLSSLHCVTSILTALCHFYPHCTVSLLSSLHCVTSILTTLIPLLQLTRLNCMRLVVTFLTMAQCSRAAPQHCSHFAADSRSFVITLRNAVTAGVGTLRWDK